MSRCPKTSLVLEVASRVEVEPGVYEWGDSELMTIKATQENIFQQRRDQSLVDGLPITARFSTRSNIDDKQVQYACWRGSRYKVRSITPSLRDHYTIIELGELV